SPISVRFLRSLSHTKTSSTTNSSPITALVRASIPTSGVCTKWKISSLPQRSRWHICGQSLMNNLAAGGLNEQSEKRPVERIRPESTSRMGPHVGRGLRKIEPQSLEEWGSLREIH